jgi:hypothetical protein
LERRDARVAAADLEGDGGGGKLCPRTAICELTAWKVSVAVFCVTAFFAGLLAAVYVAFAASARFNAQRLLVAAEMAFRPAALSFRLGFGFSVDSPACFLVSAHLFRCASAIAFLPAALIFRRLRFVGPGVVAGSAGPPESMARSSLICESMRRFCSSNPRTAAAMISGVSFVGM